jgi:glycosyltransferase involved in cell wall biosynthesis
MKDRNNPQATVLITAYNHPKYLDEAIKSALQQDYDNLEVLVVDDGSTPPLGNIQAKFPSPKLRYEYTDHKGPPNGLIKGVNLANGEFIAVLDHDDTLTSGSIEKRVNLFRENKELGFVYGDVGCMDSQGNVYGTQRFGELSSTSDFIDAIISGITGPLKHSGVMFRKSHVLSVGNYDSQFSAEFDGELLIRLAKSFGGKHLNETVANYRTHNENFSSTMSYRLRSMKARLQMVDKYIDGDLKKMKMKAKLVAISLAKIGYLSVFSKRPQAILDLLAGKR